MLDDKQGNLPAGKELWNNITDEMQMNLRDTEKVIKKIDKLILKIGGSIEYKQAYKNLETNYKLVRERLNSEDKKLVTDIDDCFTEILILFENYFYIHGYKDGVKSRGSFKRIMSQLLKSS